MNGTVIEMKAPSAGVPSSIESVIVAFSAIGTETLLTKKEKGLEVLIGRESLDFGDVHLVHSDGGGCGGLIVGIGDIQAHLRRPVGVELAHDGRKGRNHRGLDDLLEGAHP